MRETFILHIFPDCVENMALKCYLNVFVRWKFNKCIQLIKIKGLTVHSFLTANRRQKQRMMFLSVCYVSA